MIPRAYITEWRNVAPWSTNAQVEQDLVISRALVELFASPLIAESLAFRGGTALHKLFLSPQPRYSEDIDLVQIKPGPIRPILKEIGKQMQFLGTEKERQTKLNINNSTIYYRFQSEIAPVISLRLKIEINCREHFSVFGFNSFPYAVNSEWFKGEANITTYQPEELLGTKLRALYQRKKGRDLFDLWYALVNLDLDVKKITDTFKAYMNFVTGKPPTQKQFRLNLEEKRSDTEFINDTNGLFRPEIKYNVEEAFYLIEEKLIAKIK
ncbi:MAG TPA: nucleotidyl transferase AbiEii/AbiGii toxin family protein [Mariniphaga anaerophila]|uniref:Nucleotidyl transferase AbiEii/AbiGii toxin family protein n=1 Tax=Mariniphaga anaerophila TaxID=1484053 RepID=A0A831LQE3_9BACT|nr:nucleotidyl transferase AbiEii/AbiGii toxin family protein [Mariniphaga anaerophila]